MHHLHPIRRPLRTLPLKQPTTTTLETLLTRLYLPRLLAVMRVRRSASHRDTSKHNRIRPRGIGPRSNGQARTRSDQHTAALDPSTLPKRRGSGYPEPFRTA
jgi:hypothetical protein